MPLSRHKTFGTNSKQLVPINVRAVLKGLWRFWRVLCGVCVESKALFFACCVWSLLTDSLLGKLAGDIVANAGHNPGFILRGC